MSHDSASPPVIPEAVPRHIAVIMDGNGRWASDRGLPRYAGHREGMNAVREVVRACVDEGVGILTLFAFSTENWQRPEDEIVALMALLQVYSAQEGDELREHGVAVHVLGDLSRMDEPTLGAVESIERKTRGGGVMRLNLMISYSGRAEIVSAMRALAERARDGILDPTQIDEESVSDQLLTRGIPDPDFLIRTSGEYRISNFMLWQLAYAELYVTPVLWPDFSREDLLAAIAEYQRRERRFGRVSSS